jgi:hypothetical protein
VTYRKPAGPLLVIAAIAIVAGCSKTPAENGETTTTTRDDQAVTFSECMRDHGVSEFPDPDPSEGLTIDGVLNGSSLDPNTATWKDAIRACRDLQPSGFTGDKDVSAKERNTRLEFAQCIRDNGVPDFPDPADDEPLVDTNRIPSAATDAGMGVLNAAMQTCGELAEKAIGQ